LSSSSSRAAKIFYDHRLAQNGWNCRFSIADCRLMMEIGSSCYTTSSIVNRQSAIGNELIPSALGYTCGHLVS
jgi:hypothetical protein